jgi:hypothetical protein
MATISRNFNSIVIEPDGATVRVTGTTKSIAADGTSTLSDEPSSVTIYVSIVGLPDEREPIVAIANISGGSSWPARFPHAAAELAGLTSVLVVGLALCDGEDCGDEYPFVWDDVLDVGTQQA